MPLGLFSVGHLLLGWGLHMSMVCISSETLLKRTNFVRSYQLQIGSGLGMGFVSTSHHITCTPSDTDPCRPCACCHSLCELTCMSVLLYLENLVSWCPTSSLDFIIFPCPLLQDNKSPKGKDFMKTSCRGKCSMVKLSAHCLSGIFCIFPI